MTPVICLTDGYLAFSSEPMLIPSGDSLAKITPVFAKERKADDEPYLPYKRDERGVRAWAIPGTKGLEHRIGGLEKWDQTGNVSHDPANHALMTKLRAEKVERVVDIVPDQTIDNGPESGDLLVLGWGSTYGAIKIAVERAIEAGLSVSHAHLRYLNPFPKNLGELFGKFKKVLIPENNNGQLVHIIRDRFLIEPVSYTKVEGLPFNEMELEAKITDIVKEL